MVLYEHEASFYQSGILHSGWAPVGAGFEVLSPPVRKSADLIATGGIGEYPKWHSRFVPWFNADSTIVFLRQLVRYYDGTLIHLIADYCAPLCLSAEFGAKDYGSVTPFHETRDRREGGSNGS